MSIVVPHLGRGENSLLLWSNSKQYDPVCSFTGHTDVILDFAWRPNHQNHAEIVKYPVYVICATGCLIELFPVGRVLGACYMVQRSHSTRLEDRRVHAKTLRAGMRCG